MGEKSNIAWTDASWNPVTGCSKVSPGCAHCYAETLSLRMSWSRVPWTPQNAEENVVLHEERLSLPLKWRGHKRVFVNSMSDLFHPLVPFDFVDRVFAVMALADRHIFQVLTKRPERMLEYVNTPGRARLVWEQALILWISLTKDGGMPHLDSPYGKENIWPLPNVWLGTSVENQHFADIRIPLLLQVPAAIRFLSCEPLLGPLDLWSPRYPWPDGGAGRGSAFAWGRGIHWVIVGGESGRGYREMDLDWARQIRDQCQAAGVAFFFKQSSALRSGQGDVLDGRKWQEFPADAELAKAG